MGLKRTESAAVEVGSAAEKFSQPAHCVNELWQNDFTWFNLQRWGWYYVATVLDDDSGYILAGKLTCAMETTDAPETPESFP